MIKAYWKPTPIFFRKIGDALLGVSSLITTYAIAEEFKILAWVSLGVGTVGKFLTNFFTDEAANP